MCIRDRSSINTYNQKKSHSLLWPIAKKSAHHMQPALSAGKPLQASNNWACFISDWLKMWRTRFKSPSSQSSVACLRFPDSIAILPYLKWCSPWWQARETCIWYQPIIETALLQTPGLVSQAKTTPRIENCKHARSHWYTAPIANSNKTVLSRGCNETV